MELIPNQWKFDSSLEELIVYFSKPGEIKEKLFYLSLFFSKDIVKEIAILYHKLTYQFKNIEDFIANFTNNKYQVLNINPKYWIENTAHYFKEIINTKVNHISFYVKPFDDEKLLQIPSSYSYFFFGIFINDNIDVNKIKNITNGYDDRMQFDLTKPFIINKYGKLFRPKNRYIYKIIQYSANFIYFDTTYSDKEIFDNILSCTIFSPTLDYKLNDKNIQTISLL